MPYLQQDFSDILYGMATWIISLSSLSISVILLSKVFLGGGGGVRLTSFNFFLVFILIH